MNYKFARRDQVELDEFVKIMEYQKKAIQWIQSGTATEKEIIEYIKGIMKTGKPCSQRDDMLFWGYDEPEKMPGDCRVAYYYMPTYYTVAFMIQAFHMIPQQLLGMKGFEEIFIKGLRGTTGRGFVGAGYDRENDFIRTLELFAEVNAPAFIMENPNFCPEFTECFTNAIGKVHYDTMNREKYEAFGKQYFGEGKSYERLCKLYSKLTDTSSHQVVVG